MLGWGHQHDESGTTADYSAVIVLRKNATVKVLDILVPIMAACYFVMTIFLILKNITVMPSVFKQIFEEAFGRKTAIISGR